MLKTSEMTSNSNVTWFAGTNRARFFWFLLHVWFSWRLGEKWRQIYHSDSRSQYLQVASSWFKPASGGGFLLFCCRLLRAAQLKSTASLVSAYLKQSLSLSKLSLYILGVNPPGRSDHQDSFIFGKRFVLTFTLDFYLEGIRNTPNVWCM